MRLLVILAAASAASSVACGAAAEDACSEVQCGADAYCDEQFGQCFCEVGAHGDPVEGCTSHADVCGEAQARVGHPVCSHEVLEEATWASHSIVSGGRPDVSRIAKYLVPASGDSALPTLFADTNYYRLHYCLMSHGFEPQFPGLEPADYASLVLPRSTREYYGGAVYELSAPGEGPRFAFSVETIYREDELLTPEELYIPYRYLSDRLGLGELAYTPLGDAQTIDAQSWDDPPFPVWIEGDAALAYEVYTPGIAYGRVRRFTNEQLLDLEPGAFGWQDIIVLEDAPLDLDGVFAGAITGGRQDVLSHLNVLSGARGTPNAFVRDALDVLAPHDGELIRLEATPTFYQVRSADPDEAQAHWAENRPKAELGALPDPDHTELDRVTMIPTADADQRLAALSRFGAKTSGIATLYPLLDDAYEVDAFGIPFSHYLAFMSANTWTYDGQELSYADTITTWLADPDFRSDTTVRAERLAALRDEMRQNGVVPPALVAEVGDRIESVFGAKTTMVRFRSSSNAEDSLLFNGAGLYSSTNGCAADPGTAAADDPSACDPTKTSRSIERALTKVWASLWKLGAYEEREYYQLDHASVAMGVLVSTRFPDEEANGVAFTGNPNDAGDERFTVNVQLGDVDVVSPTPGVEAELDRLVMVDGEVDEIERARASSLVGEGEYVLSDAQLHELGRVLAQVQAAYPLDATVPPGGAVQLDLEFKIAPGGQLVFKQIRPFFARFFGPGLSCF